MEGGPGNGGELASWVKLKTGPPRRWVDGICQLPVPQATVYGVTGRGVPEGIAAGRWLGCRGELASWVTLKTDPPGTLRWAVDQPASRLPKPPVFGK